MSDACFTTQCSYFLAEPCMHCTPRPTKDVLAQHCWSSLGFAVSNAAFLNAYRSATTEWDGLFIPRGSCPVTEHTGVDFGHISPREALYRFEPSLTPLKGMIEKHCKGFKGMIEKHCTGLSLLWRLSKAWLRSTVKVLKAWLRSTVQVW